MDYPFTKEKIRGLKLGEKVSLTGRIYTGRDRFHKYLFDDGKSPVELKDGAIYHCGPLMLRKDGKWQVRAAGPTTSMREEPYLSRIIEKFHVRVIIGKGGMGEATRKACAKHGCVYLQAVGGSAAVLAASIKNVEGVHFYKEFGSAEAVWELDCEGLEAIVAIDAKGRSLYKRVQTASKRALKALK